VRPETLAHWRGSPGDKTIHLPALCSPPLANPFSCRAAFEVPNDSPFIADPGQRGAFKATQLTIFVDREYVTIALGALEHHFILHRLCQAVSGLHRLG